LKSEENKPQKGETKMKTKTFTTRQLAAGIYPAMLRASLTTAFLGLVAAPASAQNPVPVVAPARGFSIPANVHTAMVFETQPNAACDLHPAGVSDAARTMRIYANADGYVRFYVHTREQSQLDADVQLDCSAAGNVTIYPLHVRTGAAPTAEMPAPTSSMPVPKGSRVLPALTDDAARQLADADVISLGYPPRPDASTSPENYSKWLDLVSRPITLVPPQSVNRSDVSHKTPGAQAGSATAANWSGYEAQSTPGSYVAVTGEWLVPPIVSGEPGFVTWSSLWVGLDGDGQVDLVQAGTEQNFLEFPTPVFGSLIEFATYYTWSELLPNQPTAQQLGLAINPSDDVMVTVWVGDSRGAINPNGGYGWFYLYNRTQNQASVTNTPLAGTSFSGSQTEWIMERPLVNGAYAELSDYAVASMFNANAMRAPGGAWTPSFTVANLQDTMVNGNKQLSIAGAYPPSSMFFIWLAFH
jgi:hypothetical protein